MREDKTSGNTRDQKSEVMSFGGLVGGYLTRVMGQILGRYRNNNSLVGKYTSRDVKFQEYPRMTTWNDENKRHV